MGEDNISIENAKQLSINFGKEVISLSQSKNLTAALAEWDLEWIDDIGLDWEHLENFCACGNHIRYINNYYNRLNSHRIQAGSCCSKRFGLYVDFSTKLKYFISAIYLARGKKDNPSENFAQNLLKIYNSYTHKGRFKITEKPKNWLEKITGHKWQWKVKKYKV